MNKIYFDNAATSYPKAPALSDIVKNFIDNSCVNIGRGTYSLSDDVADMVLDTRIMLAKFFDCDDDPVRFSKRIIFTSGVTASINMFLRGLLVSGDHVITGSMEHHAVIRTLESMRQSCGITYDVAQADEHGVVSASAVSSLVKPSTKAVIINHASNVFGAISPISEIGALCAQRGIFFAVDTAQTSGVVPISMRESNIDFLAFSGHKGLLSLQGVGGFAISDRLSKVLTPLITGGTGSVSHSYTQPDILPDKFESGTLNLPGIIALKHSLSYIESIGVADINAHEQELRQYFIDKSKDIPGINLYCADNADTTGVLSLTIDGIDNAVLSFLLDKDYHIMTRTGLHCSPIAHKSMGTYPQGTVRFSFSYFNTKQEIDYCINALKDIVSKFS